MGFDNDDNDGGSDKENDVSATRVRERRHEARKKLPYYSLSQSTLAYMLVALQAI